MKKSVFPALLLLLFVSFHNSALSADRTKVVDAEGKAEISAGRTPDEARRIALDRARRAALEEAVGVDVRGSTVIYNADLINDMVITGTGGLIVSQEILMNECGEEEGKLVCTVRIRAGVSTLDRSTKAPFHIRLTVMSAGKGNAAKTSRDEVLFKDGDEVQLRVRLDRKGYMSIFSVDQTGKVYKLFPNRFSEAPMVEGGADFLFPDEKQRENGLRLRARTLEGARKSNESIMVIATARKVPFLDDAGKTPMVTDLMSELSTLDRDEWAQETKGYIILK